MGRVVEPRGLHRAALLRYQVARQREQGGDITSPIVSAIAFALFFLAAVSYAALAKKTGRRHFKVFAIIAAALASICAGFSVASLSLALKSSAAGSGRSAVSGQAAPAGRAQSATGQEALHAATLYVAVGASFREYPFRYSGDLEPEKLIEGIASLTGWDLSLSGDVLDGKDGMTVSFAASSSVFTGRVDAKKKDFSAKGVDLVYAILDSVQRTLQRNYVDSSLGAPDSLAIYFEATGGEALAIPSLKLELPKDKPYPGSSALRARGR